MSIYSKGVAPRQASGDCRGHIGCVGNVGIDAAVCERGHATPRAGVGDWSELSGSEEPYNPDEYANYRGDVRLGVYLGDPSRVRTLGERGDAGE